MDITNVDEIITLSSDEENDFAKKSQLKIPPLDILIKQHCGNIKKNSTSHNAAWLKKFETSGLNIDKNNKSEVQNNFCKKNKVNINKVRGKDTKDKKNSSSLFKSPEVVDLEECVEVIPKETNTLIECTSNVGKVSDVKNHPTIQAPQTKNNSSIKQKENSNKTEDNHNKNDCVNPGVQIDLSEDSIKINISRKIIQKSAQSNFDAELNNNSTVHNENKMHALNEDSNQHPDFFIEFVNFCGSLESIESDRMKLIKKLNKRCEEANPVYVRSQKFRNLIDKCREKLNENNLYVIAKEINDELSSRKKIKIETGNSNDNDVKEDIQDRVNNDESYKVSDKQTKKRTKIINKILNRLDKLGMRIHELEEAEVDLSDEEDSTYVQLQRYRERFVQIHKKLCEYTNEVSDANRVYCRKICFSGSKYPAINKCIENFLNKTKRFPDFSDIMKLLESQSSSLGLSSSRDSIRVLAIEIFQQVGVMLQQRRRYDLWDSFCGYLNDGQDPAENNPELEKIFKENFETRVKKEQDIFKYYTDIQCRERLEPEEIPDEEANESPLESGNEDEKEIEEIEESISKRLDLVIHREEFSSDNKLNDKESPTTFLEEDEFSSTEEVETVFFDNEASESLKLKPAKESKNNYKNCKSLKWRYERKNTQKDLKLEKFNERCVKKSDDPDTDLKNNSVEITEIADNNNDDSKALENKMEADQEDSDLECVCLTPVSAKESNKWEMPTPNQETKNTARIEILNNGNKSFILQKALKRGTKLENDGNRKRKRLSSLNKSDGDGEDGLQIVEIDVENENGNGKENKNDMALVYNVHYHQVEQSFESVFSKLSYEDDSDKEKNWGRGKVFRDLTNINRLMKSKENKKNILGLFSNYHRGFREFEKPSWKKRYKTSYKFVGVKSLKCALNHEEKREESLGRGGRDSEKEIQNNSESGSEVSNFFSGNGSGREDDNNDNGENKKNGKIEKDDVDGKKFEDEEEEEKDEENEDEINGEGESKSERDSITHSNDCSSVSVTSQECGNSSVETSKKNCNEFSKVCSNLLKTEIVSKSEEPFKNVAQTVLREDSEVEAGNNLIFNDSDVAKGESENDTIDDVRNKSYYTNSDNTEEIELFNAREGESLINPRLSESRSNLTNEVEQDENRIENVQKAEELKDLDDENVCFVKGNEENIEAAESEETNASGEVENVEIREKENEIVEDISEINEEIEKKLEVSCEKVNNCENIEESNNGITESYKNRSESYVKEDYESLEECSEKLNVNYENSEESVRKIKEVNKNAEELRELEENDEIGKITIEHINEEVIKNVEENYERKCEENVFYKEPEVSVKIEMNDKDESGTGKHNVVEMTEEAGEVIIKKEVVEKKSEETEEEEKVNVKEERTSEAEENVDEIFGENYTKEKILECVKKEIDDRVDNEIVEEVDLEKDLSIREKPNSETIEIDVKPPPIDPPITCNIPPAKKDQCYVKLKSQDSLNNKNNDSEVLKPQTEKDSYVDYIVQKIRKRSNSTNSFTASDEERVKKFLLHSPSSISITPPRQLCMSKPPSQAALQALATLRGLKGISATRIQSRPKTEDDVILIGESSKRNAISETVDLGRKRKRRRSELPVISNVQSIMSTTPKIVTVQGNAPGFGSPPNPQCKRMNNGEQTHNSSSLRISNVWGGLPKNFIQSMSGNESVVPGCSFSQSNPTSGNLPRKKNTKKSVEYVVLE